VTFRTLGFLARKELVECLLFFGKADVDAQDDEGKSAITYALEGIVGVREEPLIDAMTMGEVRRVGSKCCRSFAFRAFSLASDIPAPYAPTDFLRHFRHWVQTTRSLLFRGACALSRCL
jgi:hypothetical protein